MARKKTKTDGHVGKILKRLKQMEQPKYHEVRFWYLEALCDWANDSPRGSRIMTKVAYKLERKA